MYVYCFYSIRPAFRFQNPDPVACFSRSGSPVVEPFSISAMRTRGNDGLAGIQSSGVVVGKEPAFYGLDDDVQYLDVHLLNAVRGGGQGHDDGDVDLVEHLAAALAE